jgi:hypothetical protein
VVDGESKTRIDGDFGMTQQTERDALIAFLKHAEDAYHGTPGKALLTDSIQMIEAQAQRIETLGNSKAVMAASVGLLRYERDTLRAELDAIKVQEPVAARWPTVPGSHQYCGCKGCVDLGGDMELLYAAPVAPVKTVQPLTRKEISDLYAEATSQALRPQDELLVTCVVRAVEAHIKGQA